MCVKRLLVLVAILSSLVCWAACGNSVVHGSMDNGGGVTISMSPKTISVNQGAQQQFAVMVSGSENTAVNWSLLSGSGSVNSTGLYTAPAADGMAIIQAQSQADQTKTALPR